MDEREIVTVGDREYIEVTRSELEHFGFYDVVVDGRKNIYVPIEAFKQAKGDFDDETR